MADVEIKVSQDMIKGIIESKIQAGIVSEFSKNPLQIIEGIVASAMNQKVDRDGRINNYNSENKFNWVEIKCRNVIREAASEMIAEWVNTQKAAIKKAIEKEMNSRKEEFCKSLMDSLILQSKNTYGFNIEVKPRMPRE